MYNNNKYIIIFIIFIFSFILRIISLVTISSFDAYFVEDGLAYYNHAKDFLENGIESNITHSRPPLISTIILPILLFKNVEIQIFLIHLLMIFISSLLPIFVFLISKKIFKNKKYIYIVTFFMVVNPMSIFFSSRLLTENLAATLIAVLGYLLISFIKNKNFLNLISISIILGILSLTRSAFYYLPIIFILTILFMDLKFWRKFQYIVFLIFMFNLTLSPWILANYLKHKEYIPTTTRLGYGLWLSNNDFNNKIIKMGGYARTENFKKFNEYSKSMKPIDRSNFLKKKSFEEIIKHKDKYFFVVLNRLKNTFHFKTNPYRDYNFKDYLIFFYWFPILILYFFSFFILNKSKIIFTFNLIILYTILVHLPFYGFPRFRFPIDSLIIINSFYFLEFYFRKNQLSNDK